MRLIRFIATIVHPITDILKVQTQSVGAGKLFTVHFALVRFVGGVVRTTVEILVAHPHNRNALLRDGALEEVIVADHLRVIVQTTADTGRLIRLVVALTYVVAQVLPVNAAMQVALEMGRSVALLFRS